MDDIEVIDAKPDLYTNGAYIEPNIEVQESMWPYRTMGTTEYDLYGQMAYVSKDNTFDSLKQLYINRGINLTEFDSMSDVRSYIEKGDDERYSVNHGVEVEKEEDKNKIKLSIMSERFGEGFTPFQPTDVGQIDYGIEGYIGSSFLASHASLSLESYINSTSGTKARITSAYAMRGSYTTQYSDLPTTMDSVFPLFVVIVYTLPIMYLLQKAVDEKQTKTRESMRMMGMQDGPYWLSWFTMYSFQVLIISIIMTLGTGFTVFSGSNVFLIFLMYFLYGLSNFGYCILMISIFSSVKTVSVGGLVLHLMNFYLRYAFPGSTSLVWRIVMSIFPPLSLSNVSKPLWMLQTYKHIGFSTISEIYTNYSLQWFYIMAVVNIFVWIIVSLYISAILPTEFGTRKHP